MSKLYLYSIFHGNLNYSSIPYESFHEIIDKCYWPILDVIKEFKFKTAIEFPIRTLDKIENIDPLFIKELKKTILNKKCELVCSGQEQVVFPLVPEDINRTNLHKGKFEIQKRFEVNCETAFVNEQIFSSGLTPLYIDENFKNIILIRESIRSSSFSKKENFIPVKFFYKNKNLNVIWNSYFAYKQFQKYIDGKISKSNYLKYIYTHKQKNDNCFPMYGSDMEIFGYKNPVLGLSGDGKELHRFYQLLEALEKNSDLEFILPSELIKKFPPHKTININSFRYSILEKKPDVKLTRWATCGRDNSKTNSICYQLLKKLRILDGLSYNNKNLLDTYLCDLIDCWASDYRTHTTETKHHNFNKITNLLNENLEKAIEKKIKQFSQRNKTNDLIIVNPNKYDWNKLPLELKLHFQPGMFFNDVCIYSNGKEITSQIEDTKFYKDKSIRNTTLVFEPQIKSNSCITIALQSKISRIRHNLKKQNNICTSNVELILNRKNGSISELKFSKIEKKPMMKFSKKTSNLKSQLPFSGNMISIDRNGKKFTDLVNTKIFFEDRLNPIRSKLFCNIDLPFANVTKIFYVYENHPRLDIKYIFNFKEFQPAIFRVGAVTFNSDAFNKKPLYCSTNNGGQLESFILEEKPIMHDKLIQPKLTNSSCLGSTECLIDFGDDEKGISIFSDKSTWYSVPMITYNTFGNNFHFSITHSVSDLDDTTMTWWKGRKEISFLMMGRSTNISMMEKTSQMLFLGLLCISKNKNIKVS